MTEAPVYKLTEDQWDRIVGNLFDADLATTNPHIRDQRVRACWDNGLAHMVERKPGFNWVHHLGEDPRPWPWR